MPATSEVPKNDRGGDKFVELDVLRSAEGLKAIISQRRETGVITFAILREFTRGGGDAETTSFIPETLLSDMMDMLEQVRKRIEEIRIKGLAPRYERVRRG